MNKIIIFMYFNAIAIAAAIDTSTGSSTMTSTVSSTMTSTATTTSTTTTMEDKTVESLIYIVVIVVCLVTTYFVAKYLIRCCKNLDNRYWENQKILSDKKHQEMDMIKRKKEEIELNNLIAKYHLEDYERSEGAGQYRSSEVNIEPDTNRELNHNTINPLVLNAQIQTDEFTCVVISKKVPTPYYDNNDSIC